MAQRICHSRRACPVPQSAGVPRAAGAGAQTVRGASAEPLRWIDITARYAGDEAVVVDPGSAIAAGLGDLAEGLPRPSIIW